MDDSLGKLVAELVAVGGESRSPKQASAHDRIVQAALELFAERSYEGATTRAIAQRAGVTERTLFKHFPSKEQLFAHTVFPALLRVFAPITIQPVAHLLDTHAGNFEATLRALVVNRIEFAARHPALITMAAREILLRPAFRAAIVAFFDQQIRSHAEVVIAQARTSGQIQDLPTEVVLRAVIGQLATYVVTRVVWAPERQWADAQEAEQIVALIMHGIGAAKPAG